MPQSYSPCSPSQPPHAKKQRITHVTAVFSDEWNRHFNPRNVRSRRRRFLNSGETISGFTAIFCDDWKDDMGEEEVIDDYVWPSKREREEDVEFFARHWDSSQHSYKRQRLESPIESVSFLAESPEPQLSPSGNSPPESLSFTAISPGSQTSLYATSPKPQIYQFDEFESGNWPSPPGDLEYNVDSRLMDSSEEKLLTPDIILSEDLIRDVTTLGQPLDLGIAALDPDLYPALISDEAENSSTTRPLASRGLRLMTPKWSLRDLSSGTIL
ncbi:hypothetical protein F5882DRAFT_379700 [Hyaloscypha sp. PMI_1271]|nr:hypothetical protein F5882DRAFT_379700 [Hyaloscypha sp. PMI_1271]